MPVGEDGPSTLIIDGVDAMPASLILTCTSGGAATDGKEVIGKSPNDIVWNEEGSEVKVLVLTAAPSLSEGKLSVEAQAEETPIAILGGHGVLADGTTFTF